MATVGALQHGATPALAPSRLVQEPVKAYYYRSLSLFRESHVVPGSMATWLLFEISLTEVFKSYGGGCTRILHSLHGVVTSFLTTRVVRG